MKRILFTSFILSLMLIAVTANAQYLSETFESSWTGNPEAPSGWTQSRVVLIGNGIPDGISTTSGEKDWQRNENTGTATWSLTPSTPGTVPNAAVSGTGVAWMQTRDFGGSSQNWGSRRLESPTVNLTSSTSPYVRLWMYSADGSSTINFKIMASSDGGSNWKVLQQIPSNFGQTAVNSATPWERITVAIPSDLRTANMKIGLEISSVWGTNNLFIDDVIIEEYTPTTITSIATGNWNSTSTWSGGVIPTSDNNVVIDAAHTVTSNVNIARMQNLTVNGTMNYSSSTLTLLNQIFGNLTVNSGGTYNSFFSTTGKRTYLTGNLNNAGTINFGISAVSTSEAALVWLGFGNATFTNTGTISFSKINTIWHAKDGQITYNSPVTITTRAVFALGTVNPNSNLTLGNSSAATTMTIERLRGSLTSAPAFGSGVTRNHLYNDGTGVTNLLTNNVGPCNRMNTVPGVEVEDLSGTNTVTGTLTINTHGNVELAYPLNVGTATTGSMTLTRGIFITTPVNILRLSSFFTPPSGVDASKVTPPTTHGSYISGPVRIDFPTTTSTRNFPLGSGTNYNDSVPTSNIRKLVSLATTTAWTSGTSITGSITGKPSGSFVAGDSSTTVTGTRSYYFDLNGGSDIPTTATIAMIFDNYDYGNGAGSDSLLGSQNNIRIIQSSALTGTWSSRTNASGSGSIVANTNYTRTSPTVAPGPIGPLATNGGYFAWGTSALSNDAGISLISPSGTSFYANGTTNIPMTGKIVNNGISVTTTSISVTRKIIGTAYSDTKTVPAGLAPSATSDINFADFTGFTIGATYTIKDSLYFVGDAISSNDTLSATFTPQFAKTTLVIYGTDTRSRDSLTAHINVIGLPISEFDFLASLPTISLRNWRSVIYLIPSGGTWTSVIRDSLKSFLDNANDPVDKKTLLIFGNDIGYNNDPRRNVSAASADTTFYRQYLRAQYWSDDWVDNFPLTDSTVKGTGSFASLTNQRVNDPYPDCITPAYWNQGAGTLTSAFIPITESGDGDSCVAVSYVGTYYNVFYGSNTYSSYKATDDLDAPTGMLFQTINTWVNNTSGVLPVSLSSFTSSVNKNSVELKWKTSSEINNLGFDIERKSMNDAAWKKVANIKGAGNSNTEKSYSYNDANLQTGKYSYRIKQIDFNGNYKYYDLQGEVFVGVPLKYDLSQNYPNPFNPVTKINFELPNDSKVSLVIYDVTGREIMRLVNNEVRQAGYHTVVINGSTLSSGIYFYRMNAEGNGKNFNMTKKMALVK
ncbi:MAG: T9SS type A sorting domain-containing protein [Ignavibacteria bacterium]